MNSTCATFLAHSILTLFTTLQISALTFDCLQARQLTLHNRVQHYIFRPHSPHQDDFLITTTQHTRSKLWQKMTLHIALRLFSALHLIYFHLCLARILKSCTCCLLSSSNPPPSSCFISCANVPCFVPGTSSLSVSALYNLPFSLSALESSTDGVYFPTDSIMAAQLSQQSAKIPFSCWDEVRGHDVLLINFMIFELQLSHFMNTSRPQGVLSIAVVQALCLAIFQTVDRALIFLQSVQFSSTHLPFIVT